MAFLANLALFAAVLTTALGAAMLIRRGVSLVLPEHPARILRTAPATACLGMVIIAVYTITAIFAPLIAPYGEREIVGDAYAAWSSEHLLGTDALGRDLLSRLIYGARNTVGIAFVTTALTFIVGSLLGMLAATQGGLVDQGLGRLVDLLMAIPALIFKLLLLAVFGTSVLSLILIIALVDSTRVFRLARAVTQNIVVMDYFEAARVRGETLPRLLMREVLPNAMVTLIAEFGVRFCYVFLTISALSFLGLGLQPPLADWGSMVRENASLITFGEITPLLPAAAIALLTVGVNYVVDWVLHLASGLED
jgi:peptide/nickel transport system permease protein